MSQRGFCLLDLVGLGMSGPVAPKAHVGPVPVEAACNTIVKQRVKRAAMIGCGHLAIIPIRTEFRMRSSLNVISAALLTVALCVTNPTTAAAEPEPEPRVWTGCDTSHTFSYAYAYCAGLNWRKYAAKATCNSGNTVWGNWQTMGLGQSKTTRCWTGVAYHGYVLNS